MIVERTVNLPYVDREQNMRLIRSVPAGVCDQCHQTYLTVETSRTIDRLLETGPSTEITVPVWDFTTSK